MSVLKASKIYGKSDSTGKIVIDLKVPGESQVISRVLTGGFGYLTEVGNGDYIKIKVLSSDKSQTLETFFDEKLDSENQGSYFAPDGTIQLSSLSEGYRLFGQTCLRMEIQSALEKSGVEFFANIEWGKM